MSASETDLLIRIRDCAKEEAGYPIEAMLADGSFFRSVSSLEKKKLKIAEIALDDVGYGRQLYEALFNGWIAHAYDLAQGIARERSGGRLRLRLWLDSADPFLAAIKWERLCHYQGERLLPVSVVSLTPFSRYTGLGIAEPQPIAKRPVKMLVAISNPNNPPGGLAAVPVNDYLDSLLEALGDLHERQQIFITLLVGQEPLPDPLRAKISNAGCQLIQEAVMLDRVGRLLPDAQILHFIGHGQSNPSQNTSRLLFQDEKGNAKWETDAALLATLSALPHLPHLVFLAACDSAKKDQAHPNIGLADQLVRAGVPAVLAMQEKVSLQAAQQITDEFYHKLLQHGVVDQALNEARGFLYNDQPGQAGDWSTPVLCMRLRTGRLFTPDPNQLALEAMAAHSDFNFFVSPYYLPLPVEVVHFTRPEELRHAVSLDPETTSATDPLKAAWDIFKNDASDLPTLITLIGNYGSNKSTQMKRLVWQTLQDTLAGRSSKPWLPLYVDLQGYKPERSVLRNSLETLVLKTLREFWPDLTADSLQDVSGNPLFRIFFVGIDHLSLSDCERTQEQLLNLVQRYPEYQYVVAAADNSVNWSNFIPYTNLHLLLIQPLRRIKIRHFLEGLDMLSATTEISRRQKVGKRLLARLYQSQLFDLVATPWFMLQVLDQAMHGDFPVSRATALQRLVDNAIARMSLGKGMGDHANNILFQLAWEMQRDHCSFYPVSAVFKTMAAIRGDRGYNLEAIYDDFLGQALLSEVGNDLVGFAYPPFQSYCCAQAIIQNPERDRLLSDLVISLDTPRQLHWWQDVLVLVTGSLAQAGDYTALQRFLEPMINGLDLLEGEQVFLAARCLMECESVRNKRARQMLEPLRQHIITALRWRTASANEPQLRQRVLATQLLSRLADPDLIIHLAALVFDKVRASLGKEQDYEFSSVRLAAAIGLTRIKPPRQVYDVLEERFQPSMKPPFRAWKKGDLKTLFQIVEQESEQADAAAQAVAALALGDLVARLPADPNEKHEQKRCAILDCLAKLFTAPETRQAVRWATADALAMSDVVTVTNHILIPYLQAVETRAPDEDSIWIECDKCLAYLIGLIRAQTPAARTFLLERCISRSQDLRLWLTTLSALANLGGSDVRDLLIEIATDGAKLRQAFSDETARYTLRRAGINLLAEMGDWESIAKLRAEGVGKDPDLLPAFY